MKLIQSLDVGNTLGEGVIWDARRQRIWWTDIESCKLFRCDPMTNELEQWSTPERLSCLAPVAGSERMVVAFESGFAFFSPETEQIEWIEKLELDNPGTRMNDGRTDRQGRFWAGSMVEDRNKFTYKGSLYCLDHSQRVSRHLQGLSITNSLCWNFDGTVMYHGDSPKRSIQKYQFDPETGQASCEGNFVTTDPDCFPDGSCIDAEGCLWNAQWGGAKIVRYSPSGRVDLELKVPVSQPSCVAFGGVDLNLLIVTSAKQGLSKSQLEQQPQAGNLLIYHTPFRGLIDTEYKSNSANTNTS